MIPRRKFLIGISGALVSAPAIVKVASLMPVRGIVMPIHKNYHNHYGFCDRLWINWRYLSGELRGPNLMRMIEGRILQVPPPLLAYDLAKWGAGELSPVVREERREALGQARRPLRPSNPDTNIIRSSNNVSRRHSPNRSI